MQRESRCREGKALLWPTFHSGIIKNLSDAVKEIKKPGTLGKPDHQETVEEERQRINGKKEVTIPTPEGRKGSRRADAVGQNPETGQPEIVQV
jgi:hypothetical protein